MPNSSTRGPDRLAALLQRLVDILRREGGYTWDLLVRITSGRTGVIAFDGYRLRVEGLDGGTYRLLTSRAEATDPLNFYTDAGTVRDLLAGRVTLDTALANGRVFARGSLDDLLGMYRLAMHILADGARLPDLRRLGEEFDTTWPKTPPHPPPRPLEAQAPRHGYLIARIPESVLRIEVQR